MRALSDAPPHILITTDAVGGVWAHAIDLAGALAADGRRITLAVLGPGLDAARRAEAAQIPGMALIDTGLPLDWLAAEEAEILQAGRALAATAARCGADIVQLNSPALAAAARFPCPVVGVCHSCLPTWWEAVRSGPMPADFAWRGGLLRRGYAACDALVAPSGAFAAATARAHALAAPPDVVWNGRVAGPSASGMASFAFTAGRLWDDGKDLATLDRAAAQLDLPVLAAGARRGPNGAAITFAALRCLGALETGAVQQMLARGPIFVSTARYEPFGLAVLEAAQAGCALVLSDIPTFRELWDGAACFVAPGDADGFAVAVMMLSRDQEQRRSLCVAGRRRARRFTAQAMATGMARIHARLLAARTAGRGRNVAA
ncbi:glycosyltransferase family 4 protein [Falsiroseomonas oryzae]|uniref:glycosyltransferase family 4 protein n=1 Tax=Falsiroseomonas oryzae TaxID=2766473 RepID=UPI0022EAED6F|nr:glycosyltransferase family 4 protein [Roseomonas sp. MO-31]